MTTASATPQQMRDRLLQAIDGHSNICNMVAVLDVITNLEKYPITKEALEETRLGKLINDVRKKTKDEDLAKRAKKLLRNWQKLIEPGQGDTPVRGPPNVPGSANGGAHPCRTDTPPAVPPPSKVAPELKTRNDIHNTYSPKAEKSSSRKRRAEQRDSPHLPAKMSKTSLYEPVYSSSPPSNGIRGTPEPLLEKDDEVPSDRIRLEHLDNDRHNKIPVNAVKPHPSSPGLTKLPSTSSLLKASVLQQARVDSGGQHQPKSPRYSSSPRSATHETMAKRSTTYAPKGTLSSPSLNSAQVPSPLPTLQPLTSPAQVCISDGPSSVGLEGSLHLHRSSDRVSQPPHSTATLEPLSGALLATHGLEGLETKAEREGASSNSDGKKRKKYRPRDYTVNLQGQSSEDRTKPRLKERRLTFDPVTGQIKPLTPKESHQEEECHGQPIPEPSVRTDIPQQKPPTSVPNPFQQTNWKELSRSEIIQSYLNLQSNVLTSSGAQTHGAHFFMTEYLKREEHDVKEPRKMHVLAPGSSTTELPGVSRDVTNEDLLRIHNEHWPGVNGCYDTKGAWFDWTDCISLDPHGDESKLNILPYVCLD
ncbi:mediator of RNA polymerase II transcription subunit 26 [Danio rerio]|uniref:mediator of RNA polymerase II transcription subunit 26 n=1 Tax=Danio rerio TaxID=7955 RepID=UPI000000B897|nr:mediator of RNA polymerase II transcription subunit 26 [Danio rerio]AAH45849.1 Cofactor required for Sp1 transcriptional activation, subunit 7 [Danio rerio]|eukprot:NP_998224.1 mediator of RNA polymerase II transcription subunit 26 [Danio rerio]